MILLLTIVFSGCSQKLNIDSGSYYDHNRTASKINKNRICPRLNTLGEIEPINISIKGGKISTKQLQYLKEKIDLLRWSFDLLNDQAKYYNNNFTTVNLSKILREIR